ncbi:uncharacterized protein LOC144438818 [Glandiceps talaboti]
MRGCYGQSGSMNTCLFVALTLLLTQAIPTSVDAAHLVAQVTHVALSTDLSVGYFLDDQETLPGLYIVLYDLEVDSPRARKDLPTAPENEGDVFFDCSYFDHVGKYEFRLYDADDTLLTVSGITNVQWPKLSFTHERTHIAMTTRFSATIEILGDICDVFNHNRYETTVIVEYVGTNHSVATGNEAEAAIPVGEYRTGQLQHISNVLFECGVFDIAGLYQLVMLSSYGDFYANDSVIGISSYIQARWSDNYYIDVQSSTIFPCDHAVTVAITTPPCKSTDDKIRTYAQRSYSPHLEPELEYETEKRVEGDSVDFYCNVFESSESIVGYCFKYISISTLTGAVYEHTKSCVSNSIDEGPAVDGGWGRWSDWTECSGTCGPAIKSHFRLCNNPAPANGGADCVGDTVANEGCELQPCHHDATTNSPSSEFVDDGCACGCTLIKPRGIIRSSSIPCYKNAVWTVSLSDGLKINLTFVTFNLDLASEWLRVRNGGTPSAPLIVYHTGARSPRPVISSGNQLYIEYKSAWDEPLLNTGFSAHYSPMNYTNKTTTPITTPTKGLSTESLVNSVVTVVGIAICGIIIITSIAFALHARARVHKKRRERAMGLNSGDLLGHMIDTSHGSASWNLDVSSTGQSMQRLFTMPNTSSMSEASSFSGVRRDRRFLYRVQGEDEELKPGIHYTSPYHETTIPSGNKTNDSKGKTLESPKHLKKNRQNARNMGAPYRVGRSGSLSGGSRHSISSGRTDANTTHLAIRTPEEYAVRGYSMTGSHTTFDTRYTDRDYRQSKSSREFKPPSRTYSDGSRPSMTSEATSPPYINREGKLTPLGMAIARNMGEEAPVYKSPYKNENPPHSKKREHRGKRRDSDRDRSPGSRSGGSSRHRDRRYDRERERTPPPRDGREHSRSSRGKYLPDKQRYDTHRGAYYNSYDSSRTPPRDKTKSNRRAHRSSLRDISRMPRTLSSEAANRAHNYIDNDPWQRQDTPEPHELKATQAIVERLRQERPKDQLRLSYISSAESLPKRNRASEPRSPESEGGVLSDPQHVTSNGPKPLERRTLSAGNTLRATSPEPLVPFRHVGRRRPDTPSSRSIQSSGPGTPRKTNKFGQSDISISQDEPEYDDYMPTLSYFDTSPACTTQRNLKYTLSPMVHADNDLDCINANIPASAV